MPWRALRAAATAAVLTLATGDLLASAAGSLPVRPDLESQSEFDRAVAQHEKRAADGPDDPESWYTLAKVYADKVPKDGSVPREVARRYLMRGLEADRRALSINPAYYEALGLKSLLLRQLAVYEADPAARKKLTDEADAAKAQADHLLRMHLRTRGGGLTEPTRDR